MTPIQLLFQKIDDHISSMTAAMASGRCADFGAYQKLCGTIHGLSLAKEEIEDLQKRLEQDLDD